MVRKVSQVVALVIVGLTLPAMALDIESDLKTGSVELQSAGPIAFGPQGILFIGDSQAAAVHAVATGDTSGNPEAVSISVEDLNGKIAAALGTEPAEIRINDLAVNPLSGAAYLSVSRGRGPDAMPVILRVDGNGSMKEVGLKNTKYAKAALPNAPAADAVGRRNRPLRPLSITDLGYVNGRVLVAGLSSEEFASTLRSIPFPFEAERSDQGTGIQVYHGAHGRFETNSPVRTFTAMQIDNEPHLLAAYTCTPLVRIPVGDLVPGNRVTGTTVAELGNRNNPLDMFVYEKDGGQFILMANSSRGVMKIKTDDIDRATGITEQIRGTAGQKYDTISELENVVQLDRLNDDHALIVVSDDRGTEESADDTHHLRTVALP